MILEPSEKAAPVVSLEKWICEGKTLPEPCRFIGCDALGKALILSAFRMRSSHPLVVVFESKVEARSAIDNLSYFLGGEDRIHYLPPADFDYYRGIFPNPETLFERNVSLHHALNPAGGQLFVTTLGALLQKVIPTEAFLQATRVLSPNQQINRDELLIQLVEAGYQRQPIAYDPGIFSVRGGVVDIFCPLYRNPVRVEFYGDLIEEIRFFDPQTQRSLGSIPKVFIIPIGQTLIPSGNRWEQASRRVKERLDNQGISKPNREEILQKISEGAFSGSLMYLFPLLCGGSKSIFDYFSNESLFFWGGRHTLLESARNSELPKLTKTHELFEKDPSPIAPKEDLFLTLEELESYLQRPGSYAFENFSSSEISSDLWLKSERLSLKRERELANHKTTGHTLLEPFAKRFKQWMDEGYRIQIVCHTQTHAERLQLLFEPYGFCCLLHDEGAPKLFETRYLALNLWRGYITQSEIYGILRTVILSEEEIFGQKKRTPKASSWAGTASAGRALSSFRDLKVGDYVVHKDFGIGRYLALKSMHFLGVPNDYVMLEYKGGDKLYIPVYRLNILQKYVGGEGAGPLLDKLGSDHWTKVKKKAEKAVAELAAELLDIQAKRKLTPAAAFVGPTDDFQQFEMEFPFDETPDQARAIEEVLCDVGMSHAMDRLLVGDVGYGKTEVAMRAALRAAFSGKQVAILVPTTVLAFQHFATFKERFKNYPVTIGMVSRLRSSSEIRKSLDDIKSGKIDILIGTHRLLSGDVQFKDLGLIVVDEEHRFGVAHKERLKKLSAAVHILSMTATPIPRTLNMAMTGIKDISLINTPPPDRLSVRTFVCRSSPDVIQEAIAQELNRDGQVFFVHNRIESIFRTEREIKDVFPKIDIEVVHGQMESALLEKKMLAFYKGEFHVLLTTAIIESGLDIPRANTIIIDRADQFGLAQLYQLRGRVGRSERRAYCYLLVAAEDQMTPDAKQRLSVIQRYHDLGSGFGVASHDLEIRGAGDLLGKDQSGHLNAIGTDLYFELLEESVRALRGEHKKIDIEPDINLKIAAFFPQDYLPELGERISLYRRLSAVDEEETISEIETEIRDRFGSPPDEVVNLLGLMRLKLHLKRLHVVRMSSGPKKTSLQFAPTTPASPEKLVALIRSDSRRYCLTPDQKLVVEVKDTDWRALLMEIQKLSHQLGVG